MLAAFLITLMDVMVVVGGIVVLLGAARWVLRRILGIGGR